MNDLPTLTATTKMPETINKLVIKDGDSIIVIRANESIEVFVQIPPGDVVRRAAITALGMYWCLLDKEWRGKMDLRAAKRIEDIRQGRS